MAVAVAVTHGAPAHRRIGLTIAGLTPTTETQHAAAATVVKRRVGTVPGLGGRRAAFIQTGVNMPACDRLNSAFDSVERERVRMVPAQRHFAPPLSSF